MTTTPVGNAKTLTQLVGTQIRIAMVKQDMRQSQLARAIGKTEQWLSVRLRGRQPIDLNDLALIASGLEVPVADLMPSEEDLSRLVVRRGDTGENLPPADRPTRIVSRPIDNRPSARPGAGNSAGLRRPSRVSRSGDGRAA
jgi:transcriptional regulator with XRE-family HTH domain